jgi:competence protein ComEC
MKYNKKHFKLPLIIIAFIMICMAYIAYNYKSSNNNLIYPLSPTNLLIHYIDVGQGDAILIQTSTKNLLIDSGPDNKKTLNYLKKQGIKKLDYILTTHPHDDHIGSMDKIISNFDVLNFYAPKITNNTDAFKSMLNALDKKDLKIVPAKAGIKLNLGNNINCTILSPISESYKELNNYSAVLKISYNNTSFLFMGDAETYNEEELIKEGYNLRADVIKIGHHGSTSSTSKALLDNVKPRVAIISCGEDNEYGHPTKETLGKLEEKNLSIFRTDIDSSIVLESDGNKIIER